MYKVFLSGLFLVLFSGCSALLQTVYAEGTVETKPKEKSQERSLQVIQLAEKYLGVPYAYGGTNPKIGFDCSGFVKYIYSHFNLSLPHRADLQFQVGTSVARKDLKAGDLVFFQKGSVVGHVGIYAKGGNFIHATRPGRLVSYSNLEEAYYRVRYVGARRVL